jgi:hypothetical protein
VPCNIGFRSCVTSAVCGGSSSTTMALRMRIRGDGRWRSSAMAPPTEMASAVFSLPVRSLPAKHVGLKWLTASEVITLDERPFRLRLN